MNLKMRINKIITSSGNLGIFDITDENKIRVIIQDAGSSNRIEIRSRLQGQPDFVLLAVLEGSVNEVINIATYEEIEIECVQYETTSSNVKIYSASFNDAGGSAIESIGVPSGNNLTDIQNLNLTSEDNSVTITGNNLTKTVDFSVSAELMTYIPSIETNWDPDPTTVVEGLDQLAERTFQVEVNKLDSSEKGAADGVAPLNSLSKIDAIYLPSYVDDVEEYANLADFPSIGESSKIYIALDTNRTYRWSGSVYIEISASEVISVNGYTGIVTLDKSDIGLDQVDNTSDIDKPISNDTQDALDGLENKIVPIENRDKILHIHAYEDNQLVWGSAQPPATDPLTNILGQEYVRDGWYYENQAGQQIGWYFFDGTTQAIITKANFSAYVVMTMDVLSSKPIMGVYSFPTGSGDILPGFAHSRWSYQISTANLATMTAGKKYLLYVGEDPSAHPEIPHIPLTYVPFASGGDRLDTEVILTAALISDPTEPAGDVKWMVESFGVWSPNYKHEMALRFKSALKSELYTHINNTTNPHLVTASQIGLGNVDNTSDLNKPISTATQNALDLKVNKTGDAMSGDLVVGDTTNTLLDFVQISNNAILVRNEYENQQSGLSKYGISVSSNDSQFVGTTEQLILRNETDDTGLTMWSNGETEILVASERFYINQDSSALPEVTVRSTGLPSIPTQLNQLTTKKYVDDAIVTGAGEVTQIFQDMKEPTGFFNTTDSTVSFNDGTRTFTIAPTSGSFSFYVKGTKYTKNSPVNIVIPNSDGNHYIFFDPNGDIQSTQIIDSSIFLENAFVSILYWNSEINMHTYFAEERHGFTMDGMTHSYLHTVFGSRYISGFALQNFDVDGDGSLASNAQFTADSGSLRDEDLLIEVASQTQIPILYRQGSLWRKKNADAYPIIYSGTAGYIGASGRLPYSQWTGTQWQLTEIDNNAFVLVHFFGTNDKDSGIVGIQGIAQYNNVTAARIAASTEIASLTGLPFAEFVPIGSVVFQSSNAFSNIPVAAIVSVDGAEYVDFRATQLYTPAGEATSHSLLSNLSSDDHLQYHTDARGDERYYTKIEIDTSLTNYINKDGTVAFIGQQSMGGFKLTNLADPVNPTDAVNLQSLNAAIGSSGDIFEKSFTISTDAQTNVDITDFYFPNATVRSFEGLVSVYINATSGVYECFEIKGIQKASSWQISITSEGDNSGITFDITNLGQMQYTSNAHSGFVSGVIKFRAVTTSV